MGLDIDGAGFVDLKSLTDLCNKESHVAKKTPVTEDILREMVSTCEKKRYELIDDPETSRSFIRCVQGHSMDVPLLCPTILVSGEDSDPLEGEVAGEKFKNVNHPEFSGEIFHATSMKNAKLIFSSGFIKPMSRKYVHMARGDPCDLDIKVGLRQWMQIALIIDLPELIKHCRCFEAKNGVILCESPIPVSCIKKIINRKSKGEITDLK
ncbi:Phosphotransferase KptA/Tpt1 like protein [Aduncisulcus paluster]|uniref:2'-phosphotransferase n=1 Tax=Aduncisulcus paluster TaxID=2918883 RepID=A0ABQ5KJD3_9EUKA|nr:Phosphotransferase KptA/Tpt1 like protein [Aduncisulcus paluster]